MPEIILRELSSSDVDWMASVGQQLELASGQVLLESGTLPQAMYLVLEGCLKLTLPIPESEPPTIRLSSGQIIGNLQLASSPPLPYRIAAQEPSLVLMIPEQTLVEKFQQDTCFVARFYRAIAQLLAIQHRQIIEVLTHRDVMPTAHAGKGIFSIFSCLQDSDICWMLGAGTIQQFQQDEICIQQGRPINSLYITLKGSLSVFLCEQTQRPMAMAFGAMKAQSRAAKEVSQFLPGEFIGILQFLDFDNHFYTIRANQDATVLAIPLVLLQQKVQQDSGFTARLFRAFASLMAERNQQLFSSVCYGDVCYECGDSLSPEVEYGDEVVLAELQQTSLARVRFNWMLQQLNIKD